MSPQYGKWVPRLGAWARGVLITILVITVAIYAAKHGVHGFPVGWSAITAFLAYGIPILAILIMLPQNEVSCSG